MFGTITIPYESVMLLNICKLKNGSRFEEAEMAIGEVCSLTKNNHQNFIAGQVFSYEGFITPQGTVGEIGEEGDHFLLITYRKDFESHEESHKDKIVMNALRGFWSLYQRQKSLAINLSGKGKKNSYSSYSFL